MSDRANDHAVETVELTKAFDSFTAVDRVSFTETLLGQLEAGLERLRREGFARVLDRWKKYFRMQGERVHVGGPGVSEQVEGVVEGVDAEGALLVRSDRALERILAGDVTLARREA